MDFLTRDFIKKDVADSVVTFKKGESLFQNGLYRPKDISEDGLQFLYDVEDVYGDYEATIEINDESLSVDCSCPYPHHGCKHVVAVLLAMEFNHRETIQDFSDEEESKYLTKEEFYHHALDSRKKKAKSEEYIVTLDDMYKGEHLLETTQGKSYTVTLHKPEIGEGHCSCPDYTTNGLHTCKHLIYLHTHISKKKGFKTKVKQERFPFIDVYWNAELHKPQIFSELLPEECPSELLKVISEYFDSTGTYIPDTLDDLMSLVSIFDKYKQVRVNGEVIKRLDIYLQKRELKKVEAIEVAKYKNSLNATLYPYQEEGVKFAMCKDAALIGDEMGLGKTLQAIAVAIKKKEIFDFTKVLVITLASVKEQWAREIEKFSDEKALVISGSLGMRKEQYNDRNSLFKITNYEAVLRDFTTIQSFKPDFIILDEAQRIKNYSTKTADIVKSLPRKHALILTGTPLENKLEDVYSIVQFLDPYMLTPLWKFAADHFLMKKNQGDKIFGYQNLTSLHEKLQSLVIRRKKSDVLQDLPEVVENNYYIDLHSQQKNIHASYVHMLMPLLNKKFLTPMDLRRIQELLLKMRMVCDSTYLIDKKTHVSPKLKELEGVLEEMVIGNNRKMVIFSEWTTMTYLIGKHLSSKGISFVELTGKIPVHKRQKLIDEFTNNPECKVFLSSDAGGTGLNLQAADCILNFEMPWNPAKLNQRIGRVNRIGQKSNSVNVINLIAKECIEEKILAGIRLKTDLFNGVFDGNNDVVEFSEENKNKIVNQLREMLNEEEVPLVHQPENPAEELPEDTPHFLNPQALDAEVQDEKEAESDYEENNSAERNSPEKMEEVLNNGLQFFSGLLEMATGQKIDKQSDEKMLTVDRNTGEVTMKFKLPGF